MVLDDMLAHCMYALQERMSSVGNRVDIESDSVEEHGRARGVTPRRNSDG
jgi:hypothetical protein